MTNQGKHFICVKFCLHHIYISKLKISTTLDDIAQESISILSDIEQKVSLFTGRKEVSVFSLRNFLYHRMDLSSI